MFALIWWTFKSIWINCCSVFHLHYLWIWILIFTIEKLSPDFSHFEPRFFSMLNLDFSQKYFQFWIQISTIVCAIMNLDFFQVSLIFFQIFPIFFIQYRLMWLDIVYLFLLLTMLCSALHFLSEHEIGYMAYIKSFKFASSTIFLSFYLFLLIKWLRGAHLKNIAVGKIKI